VWIAGEEPVLFLAEEKSREDVPVGLATRSFPAYPYDRPLRSLEELATMIAGLLGGENGNTVAVEGISSLRKLDRGDSLIGDIVPSRLGYRTDTRNICTV
jgi:hypothetical protein